MDDLFDFCKLKDLVLSNINQDRIHHATIFSGFRHSLKFNFLYDLAYQIVKNEKANLLVLQKDPIVIEDIRKIIKFSSFSSKDIHKVIIIDSIDNLTLQASNAFLKILEEPRVNSLFFLLSYNPYKIKDSLKSRCITFRFKKIQYDDFKRRCSKKTDINENYINFLFILSEDIEELVINNLNKVDFLGIYEEILQLFLGNNLSFLQKLKNEFANKGILEILIRILYFSINRVIKFVFDFELRIKYLFKKENLYLSKIKDNYSKDQMLDLFSRLNSFFLSKEKFNLNENSITDNISAIIHKKYSSNI